MPRPANTIHLEDLNRMFYIENSNIWWRIRTGSRCKMGSIAGSYKNNGYRKVHVMGKTYLVHRILYQMYHSIDILDPLAIIDHKDGNILNNTIENLRITDDKGNIRNSNSRANSSTQYKGVSTRKHTKKFFCRIHVGGKEKFLGYYHTAIEAARVYDLNAVIYYGEFARLNFPLDK